MKSLNCAQPTKGSVVIPYCPMPILSPRFLNLTFLSAGTGTSFKILYSFFVPNNKDKSIDFNQSVKDRLIDARIGNQSFQIAWRREKFVIHTQSRIFSCI